ncbi:MAG: hypothetical protein P1V18_05825 [Candidatus Gracilibacteria bacterium]|nr:hypothetical protein [Candidatus Gracilibacteria bacterium]
MISLKLNALTTFPLKEENFAHLDAIPTRDFTEWLKLPEDPDNIIESIQAFVTERKGAWDHIIALGMGGSALGIVTLKQAFFPFDDRLIVIDNLDSNTVAHTLSIINPERTLIMVISKSGGTLETMTNYEVFKDKFTEDQYKKNFIAITDPTSGILRDIVNKDGLISFPIPSMVGGRFSVLTALGLLPLALMGGNPKALLDGAKNMLARCLKKAESNPALQLAKAAFSLSTQNERPKTINCIFSYSDQLFSLGLWYQQLLAESIGKSTEVGLTPLALRGASDQHSVLQLLQEGPNDKLNIFIDVEKSNHSVSIPGKDYDMHHILRTECAGTEQALREDNRPTLTISIPEINEHSLGELFMLFQMQIALIGEFFQLDAFNQPGVEKSKQIVKAALK